MATYLVGQNDSYNTLQEAFDQLSADVGASAFTETHEIVINDSRDYRGARLASDLNPTSTFRLVIRSAAGQTPRLYGKTGYTSREWTGIYVDQVDYVDIKDLEVTEFDLGILYYKATRGYVNSCYVHHNNFMGVEFFEANENAVVNSRFAQSSDLIVLVRSRDIVLAHNVADNTGKGYAHCVWADWVDGDLQSPSPLDPNIPVYHAFNNVFVSGGEPPLIMPLDIQQTLSCMDGNVYYSQVGGIANVFQTINGRRVDNYITTIEEWRRITGADNNSVYTDPTLITEASTGLPNVAPGDGYILDANSAILEGGVALNNIACLPSWFDISVIYTDSGGNPRDETPTPTPGPEEVPTADDYDIFQGFLGATSDLTVDNDKISGVDRAVRQLQRGVECWNPEVAAGYFYVGDAAYYLYARKMARYLQDFTWSKVSIDNKMEVQSVGIINTSQCNDATEVEWFQQGKTVWARHKGATLSKPYAESVRVYGYEQTWDSSQQAFIRTPLAREYAIKQHPLEFVLDPAPQGGGPIVITDDTVTPNILSDTNDRNIVPFEFNYEWDGELDKPKLHLQGATNLFENPILHNDMAGWEYGAIEQLQMHEHLQYMGAKRATVTQSTTYDPVTSYIFRQSVTRHNLEEDLIISWHMRNDSGLSLIPVITTYYEDGQVYSEQQLDPVQGQNVALGDTSELTSYSWDRFIVHCKTDPLKTLKGYSSSYYQKVEADLRTEDNLTSKHVKFELRLNGLGTSDFDAFMAYEGDHIPRFASMGYGDEMTVEYDSSDAGVHVVEDLNIAPIMNPQHTGFLTIGPVDIRDLNTSELETGHTTLSDTHASSRLSLVPWSKIDGPNKLRGISGTKWALQASGLPREVGLSQPLPTIKKIDGFPQTLRVAQGLQASFHAVATDSTDNPYAHKQMSMTISEVNGKYTGLLGVSEMGSPSKLGVSITTRTDPSGAVVANFLAADKRFIDTVCQTSEVYIANTVATRCRPNPENHANVSLRTIPGGRVSTQGAYTSEYLTATKSSGEYYIDLLRIPTLNTATLRVDGTSDYDVDLFETMNPEFSGNEFYVDYATGRITYSGSQQKDAHVSYVPRLAWIDTSDPGKIQFDPGLVSTFTSDIVVSYDAQSSVVVESDGVSETIQVILVNPDAS